MGWPRDQWLGRGRGLAWRIYAQHPGFFLTSPGGACPTTSAPGSGLSPGTRQLFFENGRLVGVGFGVVCAITAPPPPVAEGAGAPLKPLKRSICTHVCLSTICASAHTIRTHLSRLSDLDGDGEGVRRAGGRIAPAPADAHKPPSKERPPTAYPHLVFTAEPCVFDVFRKHSVVATAAPLVAALVTANLLPASVCLSVYVCLCVHAPACGRACHDCTCAFPCVCVCMCAGARVHVPAFLCIHVCMGCVCPLLLKHC